MNYNNTGVKAYKAKIDNDEVKLTEIADGIVPANTGVILYSTTAKTYSIPFANTTATADFTDNEMVGTIELTAVPWTEGTNHNYILQKDDNGEAKFFKATGAKLIASRAYLSTPFDVSADASRGLSIVFEEEGGTTGIASAAKPQRTMQGEVYNLSGQRVAQPTKGLYIVNGRKVVIK